MKFASIVFLLVSGLVFLGCGKKQSDTAQRIYPFGLGTPQFSSQKNLYMMSYNLHNLFDVEHDIENNQEKNDAQFLPTNYPGKKELCERMYPIRNGRRSSYFKYCLPTDWTARKLDHKIDVIKRVVTYSNRIPDVLGVSEIENAKVASQLAQAIGYKAFEITQSPDQRGIDVALFYNPLKLELIEVEQVPMLAPEYTGKATRNSLLAHFKIAGGPQDEILAISVNHWPSQGNSDEERSQVARLTMQSLEKARERYLKKFYIKKYHAVMLGDFNTIRDDSPHPFNDVVYQNHWSVGFQDLEEQRNRQYPDHGDLPGTYYFRRDQTWNKLDRFFVSRSLLSANGVRADIASFKIIAEKFMLREYQIRDDSGRMVRTIGIPNGFRHEKDELEKMGVSDHLPISFKLNY